MPTSVHIGGTGFVPNLIIKAATSIRLYASLVTTGTPMASADHETIGPFGYKSSLNKPSALNSPLAL